MNTQTGETEDIAPAERRRMQAEINKAKQEEEDRLMEERIRAELEKDPDAIEDDIRKMVLLEKTKKMGASDMDSTLNDTQARAGNRFK